MALDKVIQVILDDGKKEAERILAEGRTERGKIIGEAKIEGEKIKNDRSEEAEIYVTRMRTQETARAEIESKKVVLKAQKESLDDVYNLALKRLSEKWSGKLIETILRQKSSEVKDGLVYSNEKDKATVERIVGTYGGSFGGVIECAGGVIIENRDKTVRTDYRLETVLKDVWDESVIEVTSLLWGKG